MEYGPGLVKVGEVWVSDVPRDMVRESCFLPVGVRHT